MTLPWQSRAPGLWPENASFWAWKSWSAWCHTGLSQETQSWASSWSCASWPVLRTWVCARKFEPTPCSVRSISGPDKGTESSHRETPLSETPGPSASYQWQWRPALGASIVPSRTRALSFSGFACLSRTATERWSQCWIGPGAPSGWSANPGACPTDRRPWHWRKRLEAGASGSCRSAPPHS